MPNQNKTPDFKTDESKERITLRYWQIGEMAYTAITRINKLKAKGKEKLAQSMLEEWFL